MIRQQLNPLALGNLTDLGVNILASRPLGTGKPHALCAVGHRPVETGHSVLFTPACRLFHELLAANRDLDLTRWLRKPNSYDFPVLDDLGYLTRDDDESEVLITLIVERCECRSPGHHVQPGLLPVRADLRQPHGRRRRNL